MAGRVSKYYWCCQLAGWGLLLLVMGICCLMSEAPVQRISLLVIIGLFVTHIFRSVIIKQKWLQLPLVKGLPRLLLATVLTCAGAGIIEDLLCAGLFGKTIVGHQFFLSPGIILAHSMNMGFVIFPWSLIYFSYHFVRRVQQGQQEIQRLEQRLKNMQMQFGG